MKVSLEIVGWHPRWEKIESIKAIRAATHCDLASAKKIVDDALSGLKPRFDVDDLQSGQDLAQQLADLGAVISCVGRVYDSYQGDEREIPYRQTSLGTMIITSVEPLDFQGRLIRGEAPDQFELSFPINGSLNFRSPATTIKRHGQSILFRIDSEDIGEIQLWRELLPESEVDIHPRG